MATFRALRSMLRRAYGDRAGGGELPFAPPFSLRRYLTFTLPLAPERFDYWGELAVPAEHLTRIDVRDRIGVKRRAARLHLSQAHWVDYLERVGVLALPNECFLERLCIGESARGGSDLLAGIEGRSLRLSLSEMPLAAGAHPREPARPLVPKVPRGASVKTPGRRSPDTHLRPEGSKVLDARR